MQVSKVAKAVVGAAAAGTSALTLALSDGVLTSGEGVTIALAVLASLGIVWAVPNKSESAIGLRQIVQSQEPWKSRDE